MVPGMSQPTEPPGVPAHHWTAEQADPYASQRPATAPADVPVATAVPRGYVVTPAVDPGEGMAVAAIILALLGLWIIALPLGVSARRKSRAVWHTGALGRLAVAISATSLILSALIGAATAALALGLLPATEPTLPW